MSNLDQTAPEGTNENTGLRRLFETVPQVAYAMARGKDSMSDSGYAMFRLVMSDEAVAPEGIAASFYDQVRTQAVQIAITAGKPLKEQTEKSRRSQVSKLENFTTLGNIARDNDAVELALEYAREQTTSGYTKLVKCAVGMKKALAKDIHASLETLCEAIKAALVDEPTLASDEVAKLGEAFAKLAHGEKDTPSVHEAMFDRLKASYPQDYVETCKRAIETVVSCLRSVEADAAAAVARARAPRI